MYVGSVILISLVHKGVYQVDDGSIIGSGSGIDDHLTDLG